MRHFSRPAFILVLAIALLLLCPTLLTPAASSRFAAISPGAHDHRPILHAGPVEHMHGSSSLLGSRSVGLLLAAGGAAWVCKSLADDEQMARVLDGSALDGAMDLANTYADGLTVGIGTLGLLLMGRAAGSERLNAAGRDLASSLLLSGGAVWALKIAIDAERPNGGRFSFPSGHTAAAFAIAPVVARHWGWRAGAPAYGLALATALARMEDRRHYLADVLAGAAIGLVIGYEVSGAGSDEGGGGGLGRMLRHISPFPDGLGFSINF